MLGRKVSAVWGDAFDNLGVRGARVASAKGLSFSSHPAYENLRLIQAAGERFGVANLFIKVHEGFAGSGDTHWRAGVRSGKGVQPLAEGVYSSLRNTQESLLVILESLRYNSSQRKN